MRVDYIIAGQGLAGSLISWELLARQKSVLVIDPGHEESASRIAAGIINPISGKRFVLMLEYEKFYAHAVKTYNSLENTLSASIFSPKEIIRLFKDSKEFSVWQERKDRAESQQYIKSFNPAGLFGSAIKDDHGSITIKGAVCDTKNLICTFRHYLTHKKMLLNELIDYNNLKISQDKIIYKDHQAQNIIFAEGYKISQNPWFKDLPFQHSKGEILGLRATDFSYKEKIFNAGKWLIPVDEKTLRAGSTFHWDLMDCIPSEKAKEEILSEISQWLKIKFDILDQEAGVRPGLLDLQPILGSHTQHPNISVFNGLGAKGALLGPYYAHVLAEHLVRNTPIEKNVDVNRFFRSSSSL